MPDRTRARLQRSGDPDEAVCTGFDVPERGSWTAEDVAFWTAKPHYQPWKDVAVFFCTRPAPRRIING